MEESGNLPHCDICKIPFGRNRVLLKVTLSVLVGFVLTSITGGFGLVVAFTVGKPLTPSDLIFIIILIISGILCLSYHLVLSLYCMYSFVAFIFWNLLTSSDD